MKNQDLTEEVIVIAANDAIDDFAIFREPTNGTGKGEDLRIEETVYRTWSGVSGCGAESEKTRQVKAAYEGWVSNKLFEYRHLRYKTYGHGEGQIRTSSSQEPWPSNRRSCRGSLQLPCYIIFEQP
ncbi:hypothetical protein [Nubsella zeaxanthinifaciens]|jgi:hypothetical protein|uniref:hypothetical protein n=1 Tax=Nubsella zeaxanthinifaciens TaxID=392412 RepID=UPI000DE1CEBD|nr:hypothetical protein [Nubsella zeaxanthinifaciens]